MRDYSEVFGVGLHVMLDLFLHDGECGGFWYVEEPKGQINDAFYEELPWRGLTEER
jgi:hypothetical protein